MENAGYTRPVEVRLVREDLGHETIPRRLVSQHSSQDSARAYTYINSLIVFIQFSSSFQAFQSIEIRL